MSVNIPIVGDIPIVSHSIGILSQWGYYGYPNVIPILIIFIVPTMGIFGDIHIHFDDIPMVIYIEYCIPFL